MKFIIAAILLLTLSVGKCQTNASNNGKLIGRWVSLDDKNFQIVFTAKTEMEYYGTKLQSTYSYRISKDSLITKDKLSGEVYNYSIMTVTKTHLTLLYLERGNLLKFSKKP
jgi:hypothetical protein